MIDKSPLALGITMNINYEIGIGDLIALVGLIGGFIGWLIFQRQSLEKTKSEVESIQEIVLKLEKERQAREELRKEHESLSLDHLITHGKTLEHSNWIYNNLSCRQFASSHLLMNRLFELVCVVGPRICKDDKHICDFINAFVQMLLFEINWEKELNELYEKFDEEGKSLSDEEKNSERRLGKLEHLIDAINSSKSEKLKSVSGTYYGAYRLVIEEMKKDA